MNKSQSVPSGRRPGRPRTLACEVCRSAKVKCDQRHPHCSRCSRLNLQCIWLPNRPKSLVTRESNQKIRKILPKHAAQETPANGKASQLNHETIYPFNTDDDHQNVHYMSGSDISCEGSSNVTSPFQVGSNLDISWARPCPDFSSFLYSPISSMHGIALHDSLILSGEEYQALSHYQDRFISDRLLKTPQWSIFGCILQSVCHIPMAMHLLIAASSMDLNRRSPRPTISLDVTRAHFRQGSEMLIQLMNVDAEPHHFSTLSSWFFLSLCMCRRASPDRKAIDQLSQAIVKYIQQYNLDSLSANLKTADCLLASARHDSSQSIQPGLVGRLLMLIASEDIAMEFEGCGGHVASQIFGNEHLHWRIFSQQRYILEQHWGESYPEHETMHDIQHTTVIELGSKVGLLFQKVNKISKRASEETIPRDLDVERSISQTEMVLPLMSDSKFFCSFFEIANLTNI